MPAIALKLNADNMGMVLSKAGVKETNWKEVASALGLSQSIIEKIFGLFRSHSWEEVLSKWQEQERNNKGYVSWNKLAEAVQNKYGVIPSQTILDISGEGNEIVRFTSSLYAITR